MRTSVLVAIVLTIPFVLSLSKDARADDYTLTLARIIGPPPGGTMYNDPSMSAQTSYRSLMSELGVVMAPKFLDPSDTLGWSGFHFSFDSTWTSISNRADFWQRGVRDAGSSGFLPTVTVMARKGIWAPAPSFELGIGGSYLIDSPMFGLLAYAKFGIHEGFHGWAIPSIAVRLAVSHVVGTPEVDMTVISTDLSLSKSFGISGTLKLDPYLGANALVTITRSGVIDTTPNIDAYKQGALAPDLNANTTFPDQDAILRWRLFAGLRLVWSYLALTAEFAYTLCNDSATSCTQDHVGAKKPVDKSDGQAQLSISAGLIF
jgi:hypothetical protein